jgi:hypothetical protein
MKVVGKYMMLRFVVIHVVDRHLSDPIVIHVLVV